MGNKNSLGTVFDSSLISPTRQRFIRFLSRTTKVNQSFALNDVHKTTRGTCAIRPSLGHWCTSWMVNPYLCEREDPREPLFGEHAFGCAARRSGVVPHRTVHICHTTPPL